MFAQCPVIDGPWNSFGNYYKNTSEICSNFSYDNIPTQSKHALPYVHKIQFVDSSDGEMRTRRKFASGQSVLDITILDKTIILDTINYSTFIMSRRSIFKF